ncbi:recombinase family protein [Rhodococcus hoagii]|nr:recombinase family protein [Prescottella equi]
MKAVIYTRVSADRSNGRSVSEQEAECRSECERNGWTVSEVLSDNDAGASRHSRKSRPAYDRLSRILEPGDILVTWEASRAQRDLAAYVALRDLCARTGVRWHYSGVTYDLKTGDGRFRTGLDALLAENEAEKTRERVLRATRANAAAGKAHGKIPYGYRAVRDDKTGSIIDRVPDEFEASVVRELARRIIAGDSLRAIRADLEERGIPGPTGGKWYTTTIRRMLRSPTIIGKRIYHGEVVPGTWEPILSEADQEAVTGILSDTTRFTASRGPEPVHLLTGIARCGRCGAPMTRMKSSGYPTYVCSAHYHVARNQKKTDLLVESEIIARLEDPALTGAFIAGSDDATAAFEEARTLRLRLDGFTAQAALGGLTPARLGQIEAQLMPMIEEAEARASAAMELPLVGETVGPDAGVKWKGYSVEQRRALVRSLVTITIQPTGRATARKFDPDLIDVDWKRPVAGTH